MSATTIELEGKTSSELMSSGIKAFYLEDYAPAVECFAKACELAVNEHGGDTKHDSLGSIYMFYGRALLENARAEGDPLGDDVPKDVVVGKDEEAEEEDGEAGQTEKDGKQEEGDNDAKESDDDDSKDDTDEEADNTKNEEMDESKNEEGDSEQLESEDIEMNGEEGDSDKKVTDEDVDMKESNTNKADKMKKVIDTKKADDTNEAMDSNEADPSDENCPEEEEPTDLQLAWECLELAKSIFKNRGDNGKTELAETLVLLGEISMENENFKCAIDDIQSALDLQKTIYDDTSRVLAETNYKLGMALSMDNRIEESVACFMKSIEHLNNKMKLIGESEENKHKKEIEEIKKLIPEIEEKIVDIKNYNEEVRCYKDILDADGKLEKMSLE